MTRSESVAHQPDVGELRPTPAARRAVFASIVGNGLEWYDFIAYGFFAASIAAAFFPADNHFTSALLTTATFAVAFAVRPLAGVLLGLYSDRMGRKRALTLMLGLMGLSMIVIAFTPDFTTIGIVAPILVIASRVLQGISIGGEFATATAMIREFAPRGRREFYSSFQMGSQALATVIAGGVGLLLAASLSEADVTGWGWRIAFMIGVLIVPVGFYARYRMDESPEFTRLRAATEKPVRVPLRQVFAANWPSLLAGFGANIASTGAAYVWLIYLPAFVIGQLELPSIYIALSSVVAGLMFFAVSLLAGALADRFGTLRILVVGVISFGVVVIPALSYLLAQPGLGRLLITQLVCVATLSLMAGTVPGFMASLFPAEVRSTGMSISYNVSVMLFGGLAPFTITWLIGITDNNLMPGIYGVATALLTLVVLGVGWRARRARLAA